MTQEMEIICVGNELLIGKTLNTNAQWLAKQATDLGITVKRITVVADEVDEIANAVREALKRKPQFIITTGGLGPTFDDKTLEGVAKALNRKLEINPEALQMVKERYEAYAKERRIGKVELTQPRIKMATIPEKTEAIANPVGTAPAVSVNLKKTILIALPGVPAEMEAIFKATIAPLLKQASSSNAFYEKSIYADNIMESTLAPLIDKVMHDNRGVYIKSHPKGEENKPHMEIHFSTTAENAEKPQETLQKAIAQLSSLIEENGGKTIRDKQTTHE
ncbi:MAG: nicotinamide mononucleotide deamidase-related protein [Candidatus Bathyarchaeota archaeon]|nr:nicotinamide mononucleotide deamidase-related protein [Candidatus Bathyarchaeota archaeon]